MTISSTRRFFSRPFASALRTDLPNSNSTELLSERRTGWRHAFSMSQTLSGPSSEAVVR